MHNRNGRGPSGARAEAIDAIKSWGRAPPPVLTADGAMAQARQAHIKQLQTQGERRRNARGIIRSPLNANYALPASLENQGMGVQ